MNVGVIMAGGFGKRLWPDSRTEHPKQLLSFDEGDSLLQATYRRASGLFGRENTYVVLREELQDVVLSHVPSLSRENIIAEPEGRDTAPCIGFASIWLEETRGDVSMVILPSDHLIREEDRFSKVINAAASLAEEGHLVAIGIKPTRPETGYGYLELGEEMEAREGIPIFKVARFTEKPSHKKAKEFFEQGNFLWNGGIFAWKSSAIIREFEEYLPKLYRGLAKIRDALGTPDAERVIDEVYPSLPKISVDYGIMEKAQDVVAVPGDFFWDDIGNWTALERVFAKDGHGNITRGLVQQIECGNCVFVNREDKILGAIGVSDLIVVNTPNGVLIMRKEEAARVRELVDGLLQDPKKRDYL